MAFELAALGIPPLALSRSNQVLVVAHGLTDATTAGVRIRAVIRDGGNFDHVSDPQDHWQGAARGGRAHGRAERGDEPPWATAVLEGQVALVRAAVVSEGHAPLSDAAFGLDQFAHVDRA